ncbi:MAG TPA: hypothetical protein VFV92_02425, partial [Candidatus Bathyarchaeia archaeon]|nr:hypothetical protein [Candidatus Bathyarchaeia archaeon]
SKEDQDALGLAKTSVENPEAQAKLVEPVATKSSQHPNIPVEKVLDEPDLLTFDPQSDAPACDNCGMIMVRAGSCYKCLNCGSTSGCG